MVLRGVFLVYLLVVVYVSLEIVTSEIPSSEKTLSLASKPEKNLSYAKTDENLHEPPNRRRLDRTPLRK
jgi:hypothetical protein